MKQFSLEEYLKNPNRKVITREGMNVRIICTDKKGDSYPILALCPMNDGSERLSSYLPNGKEYLNTDIQTLLVLGSTKLKRIAFLVSLATRYILTYQIQFSYGKEKFIKSDYRFL